MDSARRHDDPGIDFRGIDFRGAAVDVEDSHGGAPIRILGPITASLTHHRIAVLGANGSGKTTAARLINGLTLPTFGTVKVGDLDTRRNTKEIMRSVGFLFADPDAQIILPTAVEDVSLSLRRRGVPAKQRTEQALDLLGEYGLREAAFQPVQTLSGGQRQLLALAGVLATEPQILVCDEPTTRLDLGWRGEIIDRLLALEQQLVVVTHDLEFAALMDHALVFDSGRVVFEGSPTAAIDRYRELAARARSAGRHA
ncbi:energy-coupling factor ABC transporter ATP-binding protein [Rarobacter faecitabidus]|uniref:Biotin transport system ATP-binding protein n=1 Tax=Rarobacter faecitabidus TaxID=13243 RepID=A0A542ZVC6_RARFA|nr:energy-coupling factor ABC transporter ATP-binding protein [Rarobacter faecitabidus]TQL64314.1 biotin transport system ATP-binding protein [Rarobacter faecitabidus]